MGIVDEDITRVRESTDIVGLISQYVALRRVGQRWTGLCPFHTEKTPSFSVDPTSGLYHCFGCKASGDAITFVREKEQTDFVGAVEFLAARAGVSLRYTDRQEGESRKRQAKLFTELERASEWYHERLRNSPDAAVARGYLRSRGFSAEEVSAFRIGWAPDDWDQLVRGLRISTDDAVAAGLGFVNKAGRLQDFFRARILFPIFDDRSRVIGFGGRKLPGSDGAKYKNSRDNDVYHKSRALYGLNWAKAQAVQLNEMVVCEGYTDVIGFHRAGIARAVATCGTALTEEHVKLIKRFANRLVLAYDADEAGQNAAERVYAWEQAHDIEVAVVDLPAGLDPDELASTDPEALNAAVAHAKPFLQFRVDRVMADANLATAEGRSRAAEKALSVVAEHPDALVRDQYLMAIADLCRVDVELLRRTRSASSSPVKDRSSTGRGSSAGPYPGGVDDRGAQQDERHRPARRLAHNAVEMEALRLLIKHPEHIDGYLIPETFTDPVVRGAYELVVTHPDLVSAREAASPELAELLARLAVDDAELNSQDVLIRLATEVGRVVLTDLEAQARGSGDPLAYVEPITWLKLTLDGLRSSKVRSENLDQLLVWLRERRREADRG